METGMWMKTVQKMAFNTLISVKFLNFWWGVCRRI